MIDIEKLLAVKTLITHANCPDGIASALIVKDALPDVEVRFVQYNTKEHSHLDTGPGTLFCDFTPAKEAAKSIGWWIENGAIVLDHHEKQRDIADAFAEVGLGVFGENSKLECGAWLAFEHVWKPIMHAKPIEELRIATSSVREFAEFAAVRDTWRRDDDRFEKARMQGEVLLFWGEDSVDAGLGEMISRSLGVQSEEFAKLLFRKSLRAAKNSLADSYIFTTRRGTRVCMFQNTKPTTEAAELLDAQGPVIVVGFHYKFDGKLKLVFSTRCHHGFDVGEFAKSKPGGGGHEKAAGFTVEQSPEVGSNPYAVFKLLLEEWEDGQ